MSARAAAVFSRGDVFLSARIAINAFMIFSRNSGLIGQRSRSARSIMRVSRMPIAVRLFSG